MAHATSGPSRWGEQRPSSSTTGASSTARTATQTGHEWASGHTLFAAVLMMISGAVGILAGVSAVLKNTVYVLTPNYVFSYDVASWGWVHIGIGIMVALVAFAVMAGVDFARYVGIFLVSLSLIANFLFLPYYALWSLVVIALDAFIIWALATDRRRAQAA